MINFSAGAANILGACRAAQMDTILTAHAFVEKGRLEKLIAAIEGHVRIVYLEDIRKTVSFSDKLRSAIRGTSHAGATPARRLGRHPVHLRHRRRAQGRRPVASQCPLERRAGQSRIDFGRDDRLFMALPAFHSFGLMGGIVLPLISGVPTFFYPSPLLTAPCRN